MLIGREMMAEDGREHPRHRASPPAPQAFKDNAARMQAQIAASRRAASRTARAGRTGGFAQRHLERGKLLPRERIGDAARSGRAVSRDRAVRRP
jgi:acetyl-CoA carboxylase carboxyltransferase component